MDASSGLIWQTQLSRSRSKTSPARRSEKDRDGAQMVGRRSLLFVPGDQGAKLRKAATLPCDGVILDLEDSVGAAGKSEARVAAIRALEEIDFGPRERLIRINGLSSPWAADDLAALRTARVPPDTIVIP